MIPVRVCVRSSVKVSPKMTVSLLHRLRRDGPESRSIKILEMFMRPAFSLLEHAGNHISTLQLVQWKTHSNTEILLRSLLPEGFCLPRGRRLHVCSNETPDPGISFGRNTTFQGVEPAADCPDGVDDGQAPQGWAPARSQPSSSPQRAGQAGDVRAPVIARTASVPRSGPGRFRCGSSGWRCLFRCRRRMWFPQTRNACPGTATTPPARP